MSEKLFSDPRWWAPFRVEDAGPAKPSKEDDIAVLDYRLEKGRITPEEYQKQLAEIEKKYAE
jgi:hypothetical protein